MRVVDAAVMLIVSRTILQAVRGHGSGLGWIDCMDYTTSHVFLMVTLGLFTVVLFGLSLVDRSVVGAQWLAASTLLDFAKTTLQGLNGHVPRILTVCVANELNVLSFFAMYLGLRWFVDRRPFRSWGGVAAVVVSLVIYPVMFAERMRLWSFAVVSLPVLGFCVAAVWTLLRNREARFRVPARLTAGFLTVHIVALSYRVWLSLGGHSGATVQGSPWGNAHWMYSMLVIMLLAYCLLLMYALFTMMEIHSSVAHAAGLDALTGSMNRRALAMQAAREIARSERLGIPLTVIGMDLDHFKRVNDTYGHGGGDATLCAFVSLVKEQLRGWDVVARTGGEEFVVMLPGLDAAAAVRVAERLRRAVEEMRVEYEGRLISTTVSAGVTERLKRGDSWAAMEQRADRALYQAKSAGRNCVVLDETTVRLPKPVAVERFVGMQERADKTASVS